MRLTGKDVPKDAATLTVAWSGASPIDDPLGDEARRAARASPVPEGTYAEKVVEVKLPAATWLEAAKKDPMFAAQGAAADGRDVSRSSTPTSRPARSR